MREIKYRLWDKLANKMVTAPSYWSITLDGKVFYGNADMSETVVLMQDTGLKDKNGVEIHEGDIFDMGVIGFDRGCFNGFYTESRSDDKGWDYSDSWEDGMYHYVLQNEIIGNIYETPELLNN